TPVVDSLITAADQVEVRLLRKLPGDPLVEELSLRAEQYDRARPLAGTDRLEDRLRLEHHPGPAPVGDVIHLAVPVVGVVAEVVKGQANHAPGQGPAGHAVDDRSRN